MNREPIELYPTDTPPDDVLQAAWEQTPAVKLPETEKKKVVAGFLPIHSCREAEDYVRAQNATTADLAAYMAKARAFMESDVKVEPHKTPFLDAAECAAGGQPKAGGSARPAPIHDALPDDTE